MGKKEACDLGKARRGSIGAVARDRSDRWSGRRDGRM